MIHRSWVSGLGLAIALTAQRPCEGAADWTGFRGPTGQGHSAATNVPVRWSATENLAWRKPLPGRGWSSPVIAGGRVFLTAAIPATNNGLVTLHALALDAGTGEIVWNTEVFNPARGRTPQIHGKNSHASPTPLLDGDRIFVHFGHQGTACLDLDGYVKWRNADHTYAPVHGNGGSPIVVGDRLFIAADGAADPFVVALDKRTGRLAWRHNRQTTARKTFSFTTALAIEVDGRTQIISPGSGVVGAYAPDDGRLLWQVRYGEGYSVIPRPVYGHGLVFVGTGYDRPTVLAIRPDGTGDVTASHIEWSARRGAPNTPSMLLAGDDLYFVSDGGIATCTEAATGRVFWEERLGGDYSASPILAEGRIYWQSEQGVGTVIKAGRTFQVLARNDLKERTLASGGVVDGALFLRTESALCKIISPPR